MEHTGQKMYVIDIDTREQLIEMWGFCLPKRDEILTIFDNKTGLYRHYNVIQITHGVNKESRQLVATIHVKFYKEEQ